MKSKPFGGERGQYMVEFGMSLIFFIGVTIGVIEIMLMTYDYNLAQRTSWEAARKVAIGQTNAQILDFVDTMLVKGWISTVALTTVPEFNANTLITPNDQTNRTEGDEGEVNFGFRFGVSFPMLGQATFRIPVKSKLVIIAQNDVDRDGIHDFFDAAPGDHDNDALSDEADVDDDLDGIVDTSDQANMIRMANGAIVFSHALAMGASLSSDEMFHVPVIWTLSSGATQREPFQLFPREVPKDNYAANGLSMMGFVVDCSFDQDNDGWEDKFDAFPVDMAQH